MSVLIDFVKDCFKPPIGNEFVFFIENSISNLYDIDFDNNKEELTKYLKAAKKADMVETIAVGIIKCQNYCNEKIEKVTGSKDDGKLVSFINLLKNISSVIKDVMKDSDEKVDKDDDKNNANNLEIAENFKTILDSYNKKIEELQGKLKTVSDGVHEQYNIFDSKVFQLLINTVSILGIFVAIAFAGFGSTSILTNITFDFKQDFLCSVFLLFFVALSIYNILLLLMYFIFTILKTFYSTFPRKPTP